MMPWAQAPKCKKKHEKRGGKGREGTRWEETEREERRSRGRVNEGE